MSKTLGLDDLRSTIETKYGPFILEGFPGGGPIYLLPILRLTRDRRTEFSVALGELNSRPATEDDGKVDLNETIDTIVKLLGLVCEKPKDIDRITKALKDDGQALLEIWSQYQEVTQLGEASPSAS